jgi:thymidine kinase
MNGFEGSARLLLLAHSIEELKTICTCGKKALLNGRKLNGEFIFEGAQVAIDMEGNIEYQSLCADCYFKYRKKAEEKKKNL